MRHENSVFHQLQQHIPWALFDQLVDEHKADRRVRHEGPPGAGRSVTGAAGGDVELGLAGGVAPELLGEEQRALNAKYDYRYSRLVIVFGGLLREKRISEQDLEGLSADKRERIRDIATY